MIHKTSTTSRPFDVILYGASGFVGRQTVAYFAKHAGQLKWALAGRSRDKLEAVRAACGAGAAGAGIVVAAADDDAALGALAAQAAVVLSTAGPFALYGSALVAACVAHGTHYVDITGETPWARGMIDRHHSQAGKTGARIIPFCGFDSVPSDLGAWLVAQALKQQGEACVSVKACFSLKGGVNGGTLASMFNAMNSGQIKLMADPFLLNPEGRRPLDASTHADPVSAHRDADFNAWVGPFFMGPINTRVVRRSAALLSGRGKSQLYAPDFHYQEYLRFGRGAAAAVAAASMSVGMALGQEAMRFKPGRRLAQALAPAPGSGPSERSMDRGSFRCELVGRGERGSLVRGRIAGKGDPGNRATTIFVCEAALALACDIDALPVGGGVLTPAAALGRVYARRLVAAGMTIEPIGS